MTEEDAHRAAVEAGYAPLPEYIAHQREAHVAKTFLGVALYAAYLKIAQAERSTVITVCRDALRKNLGEA